ncbi:hypothetical protein E8E13_002378 [Curvularia kusanoi]|uniref:D-isomer specific 2-hydroxyacid dehydrogenase NAD-binding domain-containing protein n=1 Tax=Curvularia kusanoi TaxID=90978 RepID=A0A9P4T494_CURKU|nr:hypothetical protein E8E13_002378 [Curvularia kusanoi]
MSVPKSATATLQYLDSTQANPAVNQSQPHHLHSSAHMSPPKVVITRNLGQGAQAFLQSQSTDLEVAQWQSDEPCPRAWLLQTVPGATGLLIMVSDLIDTELLSAAGPQLKTIATFSTGTDHIDLPALKARGIRLGYITDCLSDAVADLAVMLVLMAQRRGAEALARVSRGDWPQLPWHPGLMTGPQIRGKTVGFLGFGRIAQATAKRLLGFGIAKVVYVTSKPGVSVKEDYYGLSGDAEKVQVEVVSDLSRLASESDVVVVGCGLTPSTRHLVNAEFLSKMKKTAVLVNIARGPVVDTNALVEALDMGLIFGAGLDVIEGEPDIPADHPILKQPRWLWSLCRTF